LLYLGDAVRAAAGPERRFRTPTILAQALGAALWPCALALSETAMKLSARNQIEGKIVEVRKGATTSHVRVDIGNGVIMTSSITNEAVEELRLEAGNDAIVVVKASDVMIAVA
jgi:molybdopterin-binding protein